MDCNIFLGFLKTCVIQIQSLKQINWTVNRIELKLYRIQTLMVLANLLKNTRGIKTEQPRVCFPFYTLKSCMPQFRWFGGNARFWKQQPCGVSYPAKQTSQYHV